MSMLAKFLSKEAGSGGKALSFLNKNKVPLAAGGAGAAAMGAYDAATDDDDIVSDTYKSARDKLSDLGEDGQEGIISLIKRLGLA